MPLTPDGKACDSEDTVSIPVTTVSRQRPSPLDQLFNSILQLTLTWAFQLRDQPHLQSKLLQKCDTTHTASLAQQSKVLHMNGDRLNPGSPGPLQVSIDMPSHSSSFANWGCQS